MHLDEVGDGRSSTRETGRARSDTSESPTREVRFFAAARDAAGESSTYVTAGTVEELTDALVGEFGEKLGRVLEVSSLLIDGQVLDVSESGGQELPAAEVVDVLPPFAGG